MFFSFLPSEALFPAAFFSSAEAFSPAVLSFPGRSLRPILGPARCGTRYGVIAAHFQTNLRNSCKNRTPPPLRIAPPPPSFAAAGGPPPPPHPDSLRSPLLRQHPTRPARLPRLHPVYALRSTRIVRPQPAHIAHLFPIPGIQPPPRCRRNSSPPTPRLPPPHSSTPPAPPPPAPGLSRRPARPPRAAAPLLAGNKEGKRNFPSKRQFFWRSAFLLIFRRSFTSAGVCPSLPAPGSRGPELPSVPVLFPRAAGPLPRFPDRRGAECGGRRQNQAAD